MKSFRVRQVSHLSRFPAHDISMGRDAFFRSGWRWFTCVETSSDDQPAFELDNWTTHEVRFWASLHLGYGPHAIHHLYPMPVYEDLVLSSSEALISDGSKLRDLISKTDTDDYWMRGNSGIVPKLASDFTTFEPDEGKEQQARLVYNCFDLSNPVLIRGLHALIKSEMAFNHFQFRDSSISMSHISLDALFELVRSRLREQGEANPTSAMAGQYVEEMHGWPPSGRNFFQDYYDDRVRNFHTNSRFGAEPIPFFSIDDIWHLNEHLRETYFSLITGHIYPETQKDVIDYLSFHAPEKD